MNALRTLALGALLAACGPDDDGAPTTTAGGEQAATEPTTPPEPRAAAVDAPAAESENTNAAEPEEDAALRAEALLLLDHAERIDLDAPREDRLRSLDALAALRLTDRVMRQIRAICMEAHVRVLEAEVHTATAREGMDAYPDEASIPPAERERISAEIDASNALIAEARPRFGECLAGLQDLRDRFESGPTDRTVISLGHAPSAASLLGAAAST